MARTYLDHLKPEYLRYYYAAKLNDRIEDLDLNLEDFIQRINSDLVGKVVNIASRCAKFIERGFSGQLSSQLDDIELYEKFAGARESIAASYENRAFSRGMREIMALADQANQYVNDQKPWVIVAGFIQERKAASSLHARHQSFSSSDFFFWHRVLPHAVSSAQLSFSINL